jgi:hypothetical protein
MGPRKERVPMDPKLSETKGNQRIRLELICLALICTSCANYQQQEYRDDMCRNYVVPNHGLPLELENSP